MFTFILFFTKTFGGLCFVLYINIPFDTVDVNVHPAKTEVRFSDEKSIFDARTVGRAIRPAGTNQVP
jgi:DNA mismatch repair protein MutL